MSQENNTGQKKKTANQTGKKSGGKSTNDKVEGTDNKGDSPKKNVVSRSFNDMWVQVECHTEWISFCLQKTLDKSHIKTNQTRDNRNDNEQKFSISFQIDLMATVLFVLGLATRLYRLEEPRWVTYKLLYTGFNL